MVILKYSEAKLYLSILLSGACTLLFLYLFLYPETVAGMRRIGVFATVFGRFFMSLPLWLSGLVVTVNMALIASGDLAAIRGTAKGLYVRSFWRAHDISWKQLLRIRIEETVHKNAVSYRLLFDISGDGLGHTVKLDMQHTRAGGSEIPLILEAIDRHRQMSSIPGRAGGEAGYGASAPRRGSAETVQAAPAAAPARPAFGRKGV